MRKRFIPLVFLVGVAVGVGGSYTVWRQFMGGDLSRRNTARNPLARRLGDPQWAEPLKLAGVENFHKVSATLYRGGQPTAEGFENLKAIGIKTVVNLRQLRSDSDDIGGVSLAYEHITFNPLKPKHDEVVRFLRIVSDEASQPVFVHCKHGSDRTGMFCAVYRSAVQGWSKEEAAAEWTQGGFGFHQMYQNLINFFSELDIQEAKQQAGLESE